MTTRLYLRSVSMQDGPPLTDSIPVDRFFVNAYPPEEIWVETDLATTPDPGKSATFHLSQNLNIGFRVVRGTVERKVHK